MGAKQQEFDRVQEGGRMGAKLDVSGTIAGQG